MKHRNYEGQFQQFVIREHNYCFMRCNKCYKYLGVNTEAKVNRLMKIKVWPTIRLQ